MKAYLALSRVDLATRRPCPLLARERGADHPAPIQSAVRRRFPELLRVTAEKASEVCGLPPLSELTIGFVYLR